MSYKRQHVSYPNVTNSLCQRMSYKGQRVSYPSVTNSLCQRMSNKRQRVSYPSVTVVVIVDTCKDSCHVLSIYYHFHCDKNFRP